MMKLKQKPLALVCYLCGREFGTHSLKIHLRSCKSRYQQSHSDLAKGKVPEQPVLLQQVLGGRLEAAEEYNRLASDFHKYQVLPACPHCHRTFNEQSFQGHERVCPKRPKDPPYYPKAQTDTPAPRLPRTLVCCVCGREFGISSLKIHYPQCCQKFKAEQSRKEKGERRILATFASQQLHKISFKQDWKAEQLQKFNERATELFEEHSKVHCLGCKRRFMPEPYKRHLKHCQLHFPQPQTSQNSRENSNSQSKIPRVLVCHICGMQFGLSSLLIHQKTCAVKFISNEQLKPPQSRKALPFISPQIISSFNFKSISEWTQAQIKNYNSIAAKVFETQAMRKCSFCLRTFNQQAFDKHLGYCNRQKEKAQGETEEKKTQNVGSNIIRRRQPHSEKQKETETAANEVPLVTGNKPKETIRVNQLIIMEQSVEESLQQTKAQTKGQLNKNQREAKQTIRKQKQSSQNNTIPNFQEQLKLPNSQSNQEPQQVQFSQPAKQLQSYPKDAIMAKQQETAHSPAFNNHQQQPRPTQLFTKNNQITFKGSKVLLQEQNHQNKQIQDIQLSQCTKCNRKFVVQRLLKHQSVCKGQQKLTLPSQQIPIQNKSDSKLTIQKQIEQKAKQESKQLFQRNREKPLQNAGLKENNRNNLDNKAQDIKPENNQYQNKGRKASQPAKTGARLKQQEEYTQFIEQEKLELVKCKSCARKFRVDRIEVHQRVCIRQNSRKKLETHKNPVEQQSHPIEQQKRPIEKPKHPIERPRRSIERPHEASKEQGKIHLSEAQRNKSYASEMAKHKFTTMLKEIKSRKVKDSEIDQQLDVELRTVENGGSSARLKQADSKIQELETHAEPVQQVKVGKWKKKRRTVACKQE